MSYTPEDVARLVEAARAVVRMPSRHGSVVIVNVSDFNELAGALKALTAPQPTPTEEPHVCGHCARFVDVPCDEGGPRIGKCDKRARVWGGTTACAWRTPKP